MTRTVICGADRSPWAHLVVEAAAALAEGLDARLLLVHSRPSRAIPLTRATPHPGLPGWAPYDDGHEEPPYDLLDRLLQHAGSGFAETLVLDGEPATALCELAESVGAELVVVGSRGMGRIGTMLLGSVSADVARRAPCPVVVIPHAALGDVERPVVDGATIVCGIGTPEDRRLGRVAAALASGLGFRLRLVHVLTLLSEMVFVPVGGMVPAVVAPPARPRTREVAAMLHDVLDDILDEHPELHGRTDWCLRSGDPGRELAQLAARSHAAALVVGTCGRGLLGSALARSPASTLTRSSTVPVVICRDGTC